MAEDKQIMADSSSETKQDLIQRDIPKQEAPMKDESQEKQARAKYPFANPHRDHLKRQIQKGKFFDSGDYAIDKARLGAKGKLMQSKMAPPTPELPQLPANAAIPTADKLPPRKASLQSKLVQPPA